MNKTLLAEVSAVVEAPLDRVWDAILPDGPRAPGRYTVEDFPGHTSTLEIAEHTFSLQGGWWYRGEWSVAPHEKGTLVVHRVFNVATWLRWGVPLANRFFIGFKESTRKAFDARIAEISA